MQGIEIPIGAPLGQLDKDLKNASNQISNFATTTAGKFALINKTKFTFGQNFISEVDKLAAKGKGLGNSLAGPLTAGSNRAAYALTNLGRVAQDAPFGFIGIQNNLNPLLESFQALKRETGTTSGALKALGQSLIGPAGLGIALSVVSAGILFYQQYQQRANKEVATAKKVTDEYINSLGQVQQAQLKGGQNAQAELTSLKLLYNQYQKSTLPLQQRKDAYKEIQKLYPAYFGNMAFESTATDKTKNAYNSLTDSILASARARAAADLIAKNSTRQLENEQKVIDLTKQIQDERTKQIQLQSAVESQNLLAKQEANILTSKQAEIVNKYLKAGAKEAELTKLKNNLLTDSNILTEKNLQLEKSVNEQVAKGGKISGEVGGKGAGAKAEKDVKTVAEILAKLDIELKKVSNAVDITFGQGNKDKIKAFAGAIDSLTEIGASKGIINGIQNQLLQVGGELPKVQLLGVNVATALADGIASAGPVIAQNINKPLKQGLTDWQLYVNESLLPQLENNFKTFFDNVLMTGKFSFDSLGKALLNTLLSIVASDAARQVTNLFKTTKGSDYTDQKGKGGIFSAIGGLLKIGGGKAAAGAAAGSAAGTGGAGALATGTAATGGALLPILAGVAAVAGIASLFKKKKQAPIPQTSAAISTSAAGSAQDFGGGRVVFEISGTNLIGVLNRAGAKLTRFG
jgi:cob(I)alamin adenosyltransferase